MGYLFAIQRKGFSVVGLVLGSPYPEPYKPLTEWLAYIPEFPAGLVFSFRVGLGQAMFAGL